MKLIVIFILTCIPLFEQTSNKDIKVFSMDSKEVLNTIDTLGEGIVKLNHNPKIIEDLNHSEIKMLKKLAAKNRANAISVDLKRLWTNSNMHYKDEYYVLYLNNK